jgi:hypothetical protein
MFIKFSYAFVLLSLPGLGLNGSFVGVTVGLVVGVLTGVFTGVSVSVISLIV